MNETQANNITDFLPSTGLDILDKQIGKNQSQMKVAIEEQKTVEQMRVQNTLQSIKENKVNQIEYLPKFEDLSTEQQIELSKTRDNLGLSFIKEPSPANLILGLEAKNKALVNQQFVPTKIKSYSQYQEDIAKKLPSLADMDFKFDPRSYMKIEPQQAFDAKASIGNTSNTETGNTSDWLDPLDGKGTVTSKHLQARSGRGLNGASIGRNNGIDIGADEGTPIRAMQDGIVMGKQFHKTGYGNVVTVQTQDGLQYSFAHMKDPALFDNGTKVKKGDIIGYVGKSGTATGSHLSLQMGYGQFNPQTGYYITSEQAKNSKLATDPLEFIRNNKVATTAPKRTTPTPPNGPGIASIPKFNDILKQGVKNEVAKTIKNYFSPRLGEEVANKMVVIANLEGGWKKDAALDNTGEKSFGTFQINLNAHNDKVARYTGTTDKTVNAKWLSNLDNSLKITEEIYKSSGFKPWTTARKAVKTYAGIKGNGVIDF